MDKYDKLYDDIKNGLVGRRITVEDSHGLNQELKIILANRFEERLDKNIDIESKNSKKPYSFKFKTDNNSVFFVKVKYCKSSNKLDLNDNVLDTNGNWLYIFLDLNSDSIVKKVTIESVETLNNTLPNRGDETIHELKKKLKEIADEYNEILSVNDIYTVYNRPGVKMNISALFEVENNDEIISYMKSIKM